MTDEPSPRAELERMRRVSDQLCTAHAALRDRFTDRQFLVDTIVLLFSAWIASMSFVDPRLVPWLVPFHLDQQLWTGLLGSFTFGLSLIQFKADWRGRAEAHQRSFAMYAEVKREAGYLLADQQEPSNRELERLTDRYAMASDVGAAVPEKEFLTLKRRHKIKIAMSQRLDDRPGSSLWLTRIKLFVRDNWK